MPSAESSFQKLNFGNSIDTNTHTHSHTHTQTRKSRYPSFLLLSNFTGFLYFVPNILPRIVEGKQQQ